METKFKELGKQMKLGDRVQDKRGWVGNVEKLNLEYPEFIDIRMRTPAPEDKPSCVISTYLVEDLRKVDSSVMSPEQTYQWHEEARLFREGIESALSWHFLEQEINSVEEPEK